MPEQSTNERLEVQPEIAPAVLRLQAVIEVEAVDVAKTWVMTRTASARYNRLTPPPDQPGGPMAPARGRFFCRQGVSIWPIPEGPGRPLPDTPPQWRRLAA